MKIIKGIICGAIIGLCIGLALSFFVGCQSIVSCSETWIDAFFGCGDATCSSGCQEYTSNPNVRNCIVFSTFGCSVIGAVYGLFKTLQDRQAAKKAAELEQSAAAKKQREKWASEVKQKALSVASTCDKNAKQYKALISPVYKADAQMDAIINELANAAELKGKVAAMANNIKARGGASK